MSKYRKKPVIKGVQFDGTKESANRILAWIGRSDSTAKRAHNTDPKQGIVIATLGGDMHASLGDWIIQGVKGEFYPCKPDVFAATYEAVETP